MTIISKSYVGQVVPVSLATGVTSRLSLLIIGKFSDWNLIVMAADVLGDTMGDIAVSKRWPRPVYDFLVKKKNRTKPNYRKVQPFTSA